MSSILITGATGTFGRAFLRRLLNPKPGEKNPWSRIVCFSRDEQKQAALRQEFGDEPRLILGDVRDPGCLAMTMRGIETVVHAAALKRVDAGAYSPSEMIKTNLRGTMNVIEAAVLNNVERVIFISSDKACSPTNIYGSSKYLAECFSVQANAYSSGKTKISAVRYGNVLGSRGSVIGIWRDQIARGEPLTLTHEKMTRFVMTVEQACDLVLFALQAMRGGEVFVPKLPSARLQDLAQAVALDSEPKISWNQIQRGEDGGYPMRFQGFRPGGEKLAESLLNEEEPSRTRSYCGRYVIAPSDHQWTARPHWDGEPIDPATSYRSDGADQHFLSPAELRDLMQGSEACCS